MKLTDAWNPLKKLRQRKELLIMLLFSFVIVIFWIALGVFSSQQTTGITADQQKLAQPLTPVINVSVIEKLEQKKMYGAEELSDFLIVIAPSLEGGNGGAGGTTEVLLPEGLEGELQTLEENF